MTDTGIDREDKLQKKSATPNNIFKCKGWVGEKAALRIRSEQFQLTASRIPDIDSFHPHHSLGCG